MNPFPPFFALGFLHWAFLLPEDGWESEKAFDLFWRGGFPPRRKSSEDEDSSSNACSHNSNSWPPASQIELTVATTTLVNRK